MSTSLLQLQEVSKSFGAVRALQGVSLEVRAGEVHALLGENGAGKSTLIKIITGAHQPDSGRIEVAGQPVTHLTPATAHQLGIACIYQQPSLFPDLSVAENIALRLETGRQWRLISWKRRHERAAQLLTRIGARFDPATEVRHLSMPEQQLVEIACAVGAGARLVIMDEPTASLTQQEQHILFSLVRELRQEGAGIVYISHRLDEIFTLADRVTVLRDGRSIGTHALPDINEATLIRMMIGREVSDIYPPPAGEAGTAVLALRDVGAGIVHGVNLELRAGEIVGLAGLVGAGRTELAQILFGVTPATRGEIRLEGKAVAIRSPQQAVEMGIAYVPEDRRRHGVIPEMTVSSNLTMAIHRRIFPWGWLRLDAEQHHAQQSIQSLDIRTAGPGASTASLSGGNQQKVAVARWLATHPKVLILDEPTQGVDVAAKAEIHRIIRQCAKGGMAVLMISSDLPEVLGMSDRVLVMRAGTIVGEFPRQPDSHVVMSAALGQAGRETPVQGGDLRVREVREAGRDRRSPLRYFRELSVGAALLLLLGLLAVAAPTFYQTQPLLSLLAREAPTMVVAMGMGLVIISRQIDISVGSQFAVCSVGAGMLAALGWPSILVAAASAGLGGLMGAFNGALIAGLRLPAIVVTLATMVTWREALRWWRQGEFINLPPNLQWLGLDQAHGQGTLIGVSVAIVIAMVWAAKRLAAGRVVYAVGSNTEAARLAGLRPRVATFAVFALVGALTGVAAFMNVLQSPQVDPKSGSGLELKAIAAAVIGGVAIAGGRGRLWGVGLGVLLLVCINPALIHLHVDAYWEKALQGAIILLAVVADGWRTRKEWS